MLKNERAQGRREANKAEKLRRIEAAADRLFRERGYDATTTRDIAEAAEIGVGTLFVYFPEKLDLLVHLHREGLARVTTDALSRRDRSQPVADQLAGVFRALHAYWKPIRDLARTFNKELLCLPPERQQGVAQMTMGFFAGLATMVEEAKERGEVRPDVPSMQVAYQCFATYFLGLMLWLGGTTRWRDLDAQFRRSVDLLMEGLRP
jgi:AcrR family transcriptional regulator